MNGCGNDLAERNDDERPSNEPGPDSRHDLVRTHCSFQTGLFLDMRHAPDYRRPQLSEKQHVP